MSSSKQSPSLSGSVHASIKVVSLEQYLPTRTPPKSKATPVLVNSSMQSTLLLLTRPQHLIWHSFDGTPSMCKLSVSEYFDQLLLETSALQQFLITDILSIEKGLSQAMKSHASKKTYTSRLYNFQLQTQSQIIELGCTSRLQREEIMNCLGKLLEVYGELSSSAGIQLYWEAFIEAEQKKAELKQAREHYREQQTRLAKQKKLEAKARTQVVCEVLIGILAEVELKSSEQKRPALLLEQQTLLIEHEELIKSLKHLDLLIESRDEEIQILQESSKALQEYMKPINSKLGQDMHEKRFWSKIFEYLSFKELMVTRGVSRTLNEAITEFLKIKSNWQRLGKTFLKPRRMSWKIYMKQFYSFTIEDTRIQVAPKIHTEIHKDVARGLADSYAEVESILIQACALNKDVGYCQGMQQVVHFLLRQFRNVDQVLRVFLSLMQPPFYLGDLWKSGFPRLNLALYQLNYLTKLRLPQLARHFKKIGVKLDWVVPSWFLTGFLYLNAQQGFPLEVIEEIWDFFFLHGWPALIIASLALLHISQPLVVGLSLEQTIVMYSDNLPYSNLPAILCHYTDTFPVIAELETAYSLLN